MASIIARCSRLSCVWGGEGGGEGGGRGGGQCKFGTIRRSKLSPQNELLHKDSPVRQTKDQGL